MERDITVKDIINQCTNATLIFGNKDIICDEFSRDTRTIQSGDTYLGIKGENFNGSTFFEDALKKGAKVCIIQDVEVNENLKSIYIDRAIIKVPNVITALQEIAKYKRSLYDIPVVAITGSVGKTSTKDIIASVLSMKYNVLKTEGNLNNHIGLPLTILKLKNHNAMVVEMGMSNFGEISLLTSIAKPTVAVITNIGTAHIGILGSRENILKSKLEILEGLSTDGTLIINNDNDLLHNWNENINKKYKTFTFGIENKSDLNAFDIVLDENSSLYKVKFTEDEISNVEVPMAGKHFIYNSLCAMSIGKIFDISFEKICEGIKKFELTKNRMEVTNVNGIKVINDCYNANYDSMKAGIEYLANLNGTRKIAILGDMLELGEFSKELHEKVGVEVAKNKIDILIVVGENSKYIAQMAKRCGMHIEDIFVCNTNSEAIEKFNSLKNKGDCVLIKASNGMKFKEIVSAIN